jgi:hypothetical protein
LPRPRKSSKSKTQALDILRKQLELGQVAGGDVAAVEAT